MEWKLDILGEGFSKCTVDQGTDYSGRVVCTVVRRMSDRSSSRGVLYIHGFSDYFFQKELAECFAEHGYNFYAVDLRKYGRSLLAGQKMFQVKDMSEYFPDIQAGIDIMKDEGNREVVILAHSTGGLSTSLYMQQRPGPDVKALMLNSPFLAWNLPKWLVKKGIPVLKLLAAWFPDFSFKTDNTTNYASAIAKHLGGEWTYKTEWKADTLPAVDLNWVRAIDKGQHALSKATVNVPVLLMHSDKSAYKGDPQELFHRADAVLDVKSMAEAGRRLGPMVTEVTIKDGLHDLVLSRRDVRKQVYNTMFQWLDKNGL